ncbi:hypothetical protein DFP72DRAFT_999420 [Ephemerocybe angulata]|uniref:Uncharacterized protein n=1 Tax=Ephemerocybe angulata TaxID=980116 RepID=A0A8H6IF98_9AGAR|nr:hypothetical protein DFP72DRAFT_999420 [Tulosesus angulatus]
MAGPLSISLIFAHITFLSFSLRTAYACEGECMSGVTNVFNGNYTIPVQLTILSLADQINSQLLPDMPPTAGYLDPLVLAYNDQAYAIMEKAIFPGFFHGKCQDPSTGFNPPGCPNPDCPVVCGTPGSMVHFYSRLRYIAYNTTWHLLHDLAKPGTPVFNQILNNVEELRSSGASRKRQLFDDTSSLGDYRDSLFPRLAKHPNYSGGIVSLAVSKRDNYVRDTLAGILQDIRFILEKICGGGGDGTTNGLPYCSWERSMKEYILTFP